MRARLEAQLANVQSARRAQSRYIAELVAEKNQMRAQLEQVEADIRIVITRLNGYRTCR